MARIRNIKPGFFMNEDLAELSAEARLAFIGLWILADCEGRLKDRPKRINMELFPYHTSMNMESILSDLARKQFIVRYRVGDEQYIQITNFEKHQYISKIERKNGSMIPKPDEYHTSTRLVSTDIGQLTTDNGQLTTDNTIPPVGGVHEKKPKPSKDYTNAFNLFYAIYPRKENKPDAFKAWGQVKAESHLDDIKSAINWQVVSDQWTKENGKYIPLPASYLRGRRWEDERTTSKPAPKKPKVDPSDPQYAEIMELLK